ncbi:hypothetical protein BDK51DRAFT_11260, partial [Blyttiomyces helicus]
PMSAADIWARTTYDLSSSPELVRLMKNNEKIIFDPRDNTYAYKPTHAIRSKEELLELLRQRKEDGLGGMEVKELKESWQHVVTAIEELEKMENIFVWKNKDGAPRSVYYNDLSLNVKMSDEFRKYWHEVKNPPEEDLARELEKAGLKSMEVFSTVEKTKTKSKSKKKMNKRIKLTNTHL